MTKRWLIILFVCAATLRLGTLAMAPAWYDESFTVILSRLDLRSMLQAAAGDVHPPLWYLILWPLGQAGAPIWVLRIPAALFSIASMFVYWQVLQALDLSPRARAAALVLMAVMPIQLYYAVEARMYTLLELLVLGGFLAVLRKRWGWLTVCGILMLYTQYYGIFYLASLCLSALAVHGLIVHRRLFYAVALAAFLFLPWVIFVMLPQMGSLSGSYWMQLTGPGMALRTLFQALYFLPQNAVLQMPVMLAGFGWLFVGLIYALTHRTRALAPLLLMGFGPFLLCILVSVLWQPVIHYRPLMAVTPFLYILLARPVDALTNRRQALYAACFILPVLIISDGALYLNIRTNKTPGMMPELNYIQAHWQAGDIVYHMQDDSFVNTLPITDLVNYMAPDCGTVLGALTPQTRAAIGEQILPLDQIDFQRAWVIWSDSPLDPACNALRRPAGDPLLIGTQDEYVFEGLWLVER